MDGCLATLRGGGASVGVSLVVGFEAVVFEKVVEMKNSGDGNTQRRKQQRDMIK